MDEAVWRGEGHKVGLWSEGAGCEVMLMIFKKQLEQEQTALVSNSLGETHTVLYNDK